MQVLYIDMDNVLVDFKSGIDKLSSEKKEKFKGRYDEVPNIFSTISMNLFNLKCSKL